MICLAVTFRSTFPHGKYNILEKYMVEGNWKYLLKQEKTLPVIHISNYL